MKPKNVIIIGVFNYHCVRETPRSGDLKCLSGDFRLCPAVGVEITKGGYWHHHLCRFRTKHFNSASHTSWSNAVTLLVCLCVWSRV